MPGQVDFAQAKLARYYPAVHKLVHQVKSAIATHKLLEPGQKVLVAVSGGVDSMVLLHVLTKLARASGWQLTVAHFNHKLRGRQADKDEKLVEQTSKQLGLKCVCGCTDVRQFAKQHKLSIETAARTCRHRFLAQTARRLGINTIALGHHADDQVELFFIRLFRGASGAGIAGMHWQNPSPVDPQIQLIRPLLGLPKKALLEYAKANHIVFRQDTTNYSPDYLRNRVRNIMLPWLTKHFGNGFIKTVPRLMELIGAEADFVGAVATRWLNARRKTTFEKLPTAVQRRLIVMQLVEQGIVPEFDMVEKLRLHKETPISISPKQRVLCSRTGKIRIVPEQSAANKRPQFSRKQKQVNFDSRAGDVDFDGLRLHWQIIQRRGSVRLPVSHQCELFDVDKVGPGAILRHWRAGDRFQPIGLSKAVKLQDIFTNLKIPKPQRHRLVIAQTLAGEIFWVEGLRIGERFKLVNQTRRLLRWTWERL